MKVTKDIIQTQAKEAIYQNGGSGICLMCTGSGKSKVGVDEICRELENWEEGFEKPVIVVPTQKLRDNNWKEEFEKWGRSKEYESVTTVCYKSLPKLQGKFKVVVLDEAHRITDLSFEFFKNNVVERKIILTATRPRDTEKRKLLESLAPIVYEYPLDRAVREGIVAPFDIHVIKTPLDKITKNVKCGNAKKSWYSTEYLQYQYITSVVDKARESVKLWKEENQDLYKLIRLYRQEESKESKKYFLKSFRPETQEEIEKGHKKLSSLEDHSMIKTLERVRFIGKLFSKEKVVDNLMTRLISEQKRFLVFCASIEQTEKLCNGYTYHSETNSEAYDAFVNLDIDYLGVVDAVNEGLNLPMIDDAIANKLNSNDLNFIQRLGRIVRLRDDHRARFFIVCADETVEMDWVKSSLKSFDESNIYYHNYLNYHKIFTQEKDEISIRNI